jgi:hypothetical protein
MNALMKILPGLEMPVESVVSTLAHMWDVPEGEGAHRMDFRASQMNLVLHFGLETTPEEGLEKFETAVQFAQRYPCRIVVLCPGSGMQGSAEFHGKLFSHCYIGRHLRELCCCEALILGYSPEQSDFLENQISIWLESDLPIYHWLHRVPAERIKNHYLGFLKRCRKVIFDAEVDGDRYTAITWPQAERVVDLARARSLPFRQHIGQFLSAYSPAVLSDGLRKITFRHGTTMTRLAMHLREWHREALANCSSEAARVPLEIAAGESDNRLQIIWEFADAQKSLCVQYDGQRSHGRIEGSLESKAIDHVIHIEPMSESAALGEALFFV